MKFSYQPNPAQAETKDRLEAEGYRHESNREFPTGRKRHPVETVLVMVRHTYHARGYSSKTVIINEGG